jgi:hypothetical protein
MIRPVISFVPIVIILFAATVPPASAQSPSNTPLSPTGQNTTQTASKVWTNDNIASVASIDDSRPVSGGNKAFSYRPKTVNARGPNVKWYRDQITTEQARIPPLDAQIAELQSALNGKAAGDGKTSQRPRYAKIDQWPAELNDLQTKRQAILDKIDALRDEARHKGVPPNALP